MSGILQAHLKLTFLLLQAGTAFPFLQIHPNSPTPCQPSHNPLELCVLGL